ncbi:Transcription factor spt8 [Coemansia biformis]|uniref:Transcription factor spt8 n=1 Tax=Coemansia biformis TaxID=1286918 RepID=A0A9W7YDZ3_9FUNG|nr:Transcription factor spt8 [Coemansia biformis]
MVEMSDSAFNDDLLEKELFGGDSDELDGTGIGVGGMMGMDDDLGGLGGSSTEVALVATAAAVVASPASDRNSGTAARAAIASVQVKPRGIRAPKLDIALDDPPGEMTVLTHPPHTCRLAPEGQRACPAYNILPTMAFLNQYQIHAITATANMRWVFTGGEDGYIKRWDFNATINGKQLLTQTQRHPYVDSVSKAGVMMSYWDHSDVSDSGVDVLSPVYSMDVHSEAMWLVSGLKSGRIGLWTVRHDEGRRITLLDKHKGPVSVLCISPDEFGLVSGSWDRAVLYWDLNCGKLARGFAGHTSQISSVGFRPTWTTDLYHAHQDQQQQQDADHSDNDGSDSDGSDDDGNGNNVSGNTGNGNNGNGNDSFDSKHASPVLMTTSIDGQCLLWDMRAPRALPHSLLPPQKTPPWAAAACWSRDGKRIYVGRRNNTIDEYEFGMGAQPVRTLRLPLNSGPVTALAVMGNNRSLICASTDNVRMWDLDQPTGRRATVPFQIIPGHHGGTVSSILVDAASRYMVTTSGTRGWDGASNNVCLGYEVSPGR